MAQLEKVFLRISPNKFHFLKFILEGYDNIAILSSVDNKEGIIVVRYPAGLTKDFFSLLSSISDKLG